MNKQKRLVLSISVIVVLLGYLTLSTGVGSNQYEVSEALNAKEELDGKVILVNGSLVKGTDEWDPLKRTLKFDLTDGISTIKVIYTGDKPNIPDEYTAIQVIATGQFDGEVFSAYKMLTKCPSKYEASSEEILKSGT